jgi:hypothetical protein
MAIHSASRRFAPLEWGGGGGRRGWGDWEVTQVGGSLGGTLWGMATQGGTLWGMATQGGARSPRRLARMRKPEHTR